MPVFAARLHPIGLTALLVLAGAAQAQGVQRTVGPDGRVTYSDRVGGSVPAPQAAAPATGATASSALDTAALPYTLRPVVLRYPVTLYTRDACASCVSARELLLKRGVPFVEKTVSTPEDAQAFARLGAENVLPLMTIGRQRVSGFRDSEITQYLDAAGYPGQSQLPRNHRNPPATPLAAPQNGGATGSEPAAPALDLPQPPSRPVAPAATPPANPAGIRF